VSLTRPMDGAGYNGCNLVAGTATASGSNLTAEADSRISPSVDARPVELT
jgi:heat shock protein HslJ